MKKTITKSDSQKLVRNTKSYLECKVCFGNLFEAWQCRNGHLVCKACKYKCKGCPYCREPINSRNRVLEHLFEDYNTICPNEGCKHNCKHVNMKEHMNTCEYSPCICPYCPEKLRISSTQENIIDHLISFHKAILTPFKWNKLTSLSLRMTIPYLLKIFDCESNKPVNWSNKILQIEDISFLLCVNCDENNMYIKICKLYKKALKKIYISVQNENTQNGFRGSIPFFDKIRNILIISKTTFFENQKESTKYPNNYLFNINIILDKEDVEK